MLRKNYLVAAVVLTLGLILGLVMQIKMGDVESGYLTSATRDYWKGAHVHANLLSVLMLIFAFLASKLKLSGKAISVACWLAVYGTIIVPLALFLGGVNETIFEKIVPLVLLGSLSIITCWIITVIALFKSKEI